MYVVVECTCACHVMLLVPASVKLSLSLFNVVVVCDTLKSGLIDCHIV